MSSRATPYRNLQAVVCVGRLPDPTTVFAGPALLANVRNQSEHEALAARYPTRSGVPPDSADPSRSRQPSGVSTGYEPLRSRRMPHRHIKTTTTPGGRPEAGADPVNGGVREHSQLEEYARGG